MLSSNRLTTPFETPEACRAAIEAALASTPEPVVIAHRGQCPFRNRKHCSVCQEQEGMVTYYRFSPPVKRVFDTRRCAGLIPDETRATHLDQVNAILRTTGLTEVEQTRTLLNATLEPDIMKALSMWDPSAGRGLFLTAKRDLENPHGNGVGKSYAMHALCVRLAHQGVKNIYRTSRALLEEFKACMHDECGDLRESCLMELFVAAPVFLLDNLGAETITDTGWAANKLFGVIDERLRLGRPLVASSRWGFDTLAQHYGVHGPDIVSRLVGHCDVLRLGGPDRRMRRGGAG